MPNYPPPPPPLSMSFNSNAPYVPYAGHPQYPYQHLRNTGSQEQGQPGSLHQPHYDNAYSFTTNRQGVSTPSATNAAMKPPLGPGFGQSSNGAGQLPPPLPALAPQQPAVAHSLPPPHSVKNKDSSSAQAELQRSVFPPSSNSLPEPALSPTMWVRDEPLAAASAASDLEEGELSDRKTARTKKSASSSIVLSPLPPNRLDEHKNGGREIGRDVARKALRELAENRISFLDVAAEVVDDKLTAVSLQLLYHEIGIWISPSQLAAASIHDIRPRKQQSGKQTESEELNVLSENFRDTTPGSVPKEVSKNLSAMNGSVFQPTAQANVIPNPEPPTKALTAPIAASSKEVLTSTNVLGKASATKFNEKTFDRKGYIARMLAAKASKSLPALDRNDVIGSSPPNDASTEPSFLQLSGTSVAPGAQQEMIQANKDTQKARDEVVLPRQVQSTGGNVGMGSQKEEATENTPIKPIDQADAQAKKRAQTELARQKMEALRNRDNEQRKDQAERQNNFTAVESLPPPEFTPALRLLSEKSAGPASTKAPSAASPQSSFFSPVSGKSLFNLPGLFISNGPSANLPAIPQPSQSSIPSTSQTFLNSQPVATAALPGRLPSASFSSQLLVDSTAPMKTIKTVEMASVCSPSTEVVNTSRKRQKASDFIEPPTTRLKRHLGLSEDKGVVIEVSEDEAFDDAVDNDVDMDVDMDDADTDQDLYGNMISKPIDIPSSQQNSSSKFDRRGSEFIRHGQGSALATPPLPLHNGKGTELEGLRSKEKEIELMNRKIAELEQRRKAKQSYSRAQTPSITGMRSSPPKAGNDVPDADEQSQAALVADGPLVASKQQTNQEGPNVAAAEAGNGQEKERLPLSDQISEIEEQREKLSKMQRLLDAEENRLDEVESAGEDELGTQRIEIEQQQIEKLEERQIRASEAERASHLEAQRINAFEQESDEIELIGQNSEQQRASEIAIKAERQQALERRAAIEAGLPILDAEVEKTEQKLQHLRWQIKELETELERGIQGRRNLVEELEDLQTPLNGPPERTTSDILDIEEDKGRSKGSAGKFIPHNAGFYGPQASEAASISSRWILTCMRYCRRTYFYRFAQSRSPQAS